MESVSIGQIIWRSVWAGIIATAGMEVFLQSITKSGIANADMTRAVGSFFTKSLDTAYKVGILIQTFSGIIFAFIYTVIITYFGVKGILNNAGAGALIGFIHGAVVGFVLVATVAENHPLPEFREAGFAVAVVHWAAHILYGLLVGVIIGLMAS